MMDRLNRMSANYPLHLQREIDRRWLRRSEETALIRARLRANFLRDATVIPKDREAAGSPAV
jgi:hypothetical protein